MVNGFNNYLNLYFPPFLYLIIWYLNFYKNKFNLINDMSDEEIASNLPNQD